jgi:hypothetical protein
MKLVYQALIAGLLTYDLNLLVDRLELMASYPEKAAENRFKGMEKKDRVYLKTRQNLGESQGGFRSRKTIETIVRDTNKQVEINDLNYREFSLFYATDLDGHSCLLDSPYSNNTRLGI